MKARNPKRRDQNAQVPEEVSETGQSPVTHERVDRHYESGRNPDMQVQRSNRQGSGIPTQQRVDDR